MPLLKIQTNAAAAKGEAAEFLRQASAAVAEMLGKPERYVMVILEHNPRMLFAGDGAPLAYLELKSIGLPADRGADLSARLCRLVEDALGVPAERTYIELADAPRHLWGWNGGTF
jgi:phenylpyruvate tautomerase PptA (4-oxalocrotonate tautomerase family)